MSPDPARPAFARTSSVGHAPSTPSTNQPRLLSRTSRSRRRRPEAAALAAGGRQGMPRRPRSLVFTLVDRVALADADRLGCNGPALSPRELTHCFLRLANLDSGAFVDEPRASGGQAGFLIANKRGAMTPAHRKFLYLTAGCCDPYSATELRGRHGGTSFYCRRWQGASTVGHITATTGAPQRPDAAADGGGAGPRQEETSAVGRGKVLMFRFHCDRCHAWCTILAIHDRLLPTAYCLCFLPHTTLEELSPG
jgi:hypothetical protein